VRFSIFQMFVELDMSIRGIAHKLTEDGILPPAKSRGANVQGTTWHPSTVHMILTDVANIGILQICKVTKSLTADGKVKSKPNSNMKTIPDGLPAIVPVELYELAQVKLKSNQSDKSHLHRNPEDFLLIDALVWEDCCRIFERWDRVRATIEQNIDQSLQQLLEGTTGKLQIMQLTEDIAYARRERDKHPESILGFLNFLNVMKGKYHEATFVEKRNALDVLGVKVYIDADTQETPYSPVETDHEWLRVGEVSALTGIHKNTLYGHIQAGTLHAEYKGIPLTVIHRDEVSSYLQRSGRTVELAAYEDEWFTINKLVTSKLANYATIHGAIRRGTVKTQTTEVTCPFIHRDELNRFLRESLVRPKSTHASLQPRISITYSPIFTGVQSSFG
jgi:Recombinase